MEVSEREPEIKFVKVRWLGDDASDKKVDKTVTKNEEAVESKRWSCSFKDFALLLLDFVFTQTVLNMLSTSAWRGIWNLWDLYLYGGLYLAEPWGPLDIIGVFQVFASVEILH